MTVALTHGRIDAPAALLQRLAVCGRSVRSIIDLWRLRWRERAELGAMTTAELRDAGLTPYDARREGRKPFWRA